MEKFNWTWGLIGFALGIAISGVAMGVAFGFIYGYILFPEKEDKE